MIREIGAWPDDDPVKKALRECSLGGDDLIALSTLRGEKADNQEWSRDPSRPAIIIGTVDMIGSRLLFRGYGDSRYWRPIHAGLLGVDALIVNDETHLTPAFARLLEAIEDLAPAKTVGKVFRVLLLSATAPASSRAAFDHSIQEDAQRSERFREILLAPKRLYLHEADDKAVEARMLELAVTNPAPRTIVFIEEPEKALRFCERLAAQVGADRVALLTGTMRGWERDQLAGSFPFNAFRKQTAPENPCWLVSTSAGEVGVNLTCERLITALTTADHLIQRFGRLNRFGGPAGEAHVIWVEKRMQKSAHEAATLAYLRSTDGDISCRQLYENQPADDCSPPMPKVARLEERLIDLWSQTTATGQAIPKVEPWLHGKPESNQAETEIAWRAEVEYLVRDGVFAEEREEALLRRHRILPHERLKEPTWRVWKKLQAIAAREPGSQALLLTRDGLVLPVNLDDLSERDLAYAFLVLPPKCGRVDRGMFQAEPGDESAPYDLADIGGERARYIQNDEGLHRLTDGQSVEPPPSQFRVTLEISIPGKENSDQIEERLLFCAISAKQKQRDEILLDDHLEAAKLAASRLGAKLGLPRLLDDLVMAARHHDAGKRNPLWQTAMGGNADRPLAKTKRAAAPRLLGGFRHELASSIAASGAGAGELALCLIASHHGWARPYFLRKACDRERVLASTEAMAAAPMRFGSQQARWGPWGLAYIHALLHAADIAAENDEELKNVRAAHSA